MPSKTRSFGPLDVTEPLATIPETISEHSSGRATMLPVPTDCLRSNRQRLPETQRPAHDVYVIERRTGSFEVSGMSTVVLELTTVPVAGSGYVVGLIEPADGRSVERGVLLITCHVISAGKGLRGSSLRSATCSRRITHVPYAHGSWGWE